MKQERRSTRHMADGEGLLMIGRSDSGSYVFDGFAAKAVPEPERTNDRYYTETADIESTNLDG